MEFKIEVIVTPHRHDCPEKPYFWAVYGNNANHGFGWAKSPDEAWKEAHDFYKSHYMG